MKTLFIPLPPSFQGRGKQRLWPHFDGGRGHRWGAGDTDGGAGDTFGGAGEHQGRGCRVCAAAAQRQTWCRPLRPAPQRDPGLAAGRLSLLSPREALLQEDGPQLAWGPSKHPSACPSQQLSSASVALRPAGRALLVFVVQRPLG